jgi:hypothetical protein
MQDLLLQVQPFWLGMEASVNPFGRVSTTTTEPDVETLLDVLVTTRL